MKRIGSKILLGVIGIIAFIGCIFFSYDFFLKTSVEPQKNRIYTQSSVLEIAKVIDEVKPVKEEVVQEVVQESTNVEVETYDAYYEEPVYQEESGNRIRIGGILDKPLMKDETGENFYLNHNIYGEYDGLGVPYIDFRTNFNTRKTIIYAHSSTMGNGPFQALQNYHNNPGFFEANRYISIDYNGMTYNYEIFSVYVSVAENASSEGLEYFYRMSYSDPDWEERINWYKNHSEYDTGVSVSSSDNIIILQTCSMDPNYYERYYRYNLLIMGKLI